MSITARQCAGLAMSPGIRARPPSSLLDQALGLSGIVLLVQIGNERIRASRA